MCALKILRETTEEIVETDLQRAIEEDLSVLDEGLTMISTEVKIGTGRIDTLALDDNGQAVFIEYKKPGAFDHNALIQVMDYLSWYQRDKSHFAQLRELIASRLPDKDTAIKDEIRLILVVSDVEDRVKRACYVVDCPITVFSYSVAKLENGDTVVIAKEVIDTMDIDTRSTQPPPEEEKIVVPQYAELWEELRRYFLSMPGVEVYPTRVDMRARSKLVFARVIFRKKHVILRLAIGQGSVDDKRLQYDRREDSNFANILLTSVGQVDDQVRQWIQLARSFVDGRTGSESDET
jgi:Endonuclease NucS C-terminal domain